MCVGGGGGGGRGGGGRGVESETAVKSTLFSSGHMEAIYAMTRASLGRAL